MIISTDITKEYVDGGVNVTTTIVEFIPQDVLDSRVILLDEKIAELEAERDDLNNDISQVVQQIR